MSDEGGFLRRPTVPVEKDFEASDPKRATESQRIRKAGVGRGSNGLPVEKRWYSPVEAAEYLGISLSTLYRWVRAGSLREYGGPRGRPRRYRVEDLDGVMGMRGRSGVFGGGEE